MFFRLLLESFRRQRRRKLLAGAAILLGTTAVTAMLALATTIGDRIHAELAAYGANIVITPQAESLAVNLGGTDIHPATGNAYLHESDLAKLRTIFWANNITGVSPELPLTLTVVSNFGSATNPGAPSSTQSHRVKGGVSFAEANDRTLRVDARGLWFGHDLSGLETGAPSLHPSWSLAGSWPTSSDQAVAGSELAKKLHLTPGQTLAVAMPDSSDRPRAMQQRTVHPKTLTITGIVSAGDQTDNELLLPLAAAQDLNQTPDAVSRVEVSARTRPEDAFARQDPTKLSGKQLELWSCRPYANSIAYQIREAIPGANAEQVRKVEQTEGNILDRISGLMWLISAAALLAAGFAVSAAMATAILERRVEIGLMRSLGASKSAIAALFLAETGLLAIAAGALGYVLGSALAAWLGARIFADAASARIPFLNPVLLPIVLALAFLVAVAGSMPAIRSALQLEPTSVLRADA